MAYNITDACVACGTCADNCPVEAISEGDGKYVIDADVCVSCGTCVDNCPVSAIKKTDYVAPGHKLPSMEIDTAVCVKCGVCMGNCKFKAITKG